MIQATPRRVSRALTFPVAALAIMGLSGPLHAGGGIAYSTITISDFLIRDAATGAPVQLQDFAALDAGDVAQASASLDGVSVSDSRRRNLDADGFDVPVADLPLQCVGSCGGIGSNDFSRQDPSGTGLPGYFARGDSLLEGSFIEVEGQPELGSEGRQVTEVQLDRTGAGETSSRVGNTSEFTFQPDRDFTEGIVFEFSGFAAMYLELFQDQFQVDAAFSHSIVLRDSEGERIFSFAPDDLNDSITRFSEGITEVTSEEATYQGVTPALFGGEVYTLSVNTRTSADARVGVPVPEPASITLLGLGLLLLRGIFARHGRNAFGSARVA